MGTLYYWLGAFVFWYLVVGVPVMLVCELVYNVSEQKKTQDRIALGLVCWSVWPILAIVTIDNLRRK